MSIATSVNDSRAYKPLEVTVPPGITRMDSVTTEDHRNLVEFLTGRLNRAAQYRDDRLTRYSRIDVSISTWQSLNPENSMREAIEDATGRSQALPINIPLLATHLEDTTAFYSEVFHPTGGSFYTSSGEDSEVKLAEALNKDAVARDMYTQLSMAFRSLLKYNFGGVFVEWEEADDFESSVEQAGNRWRAVDPYNFFFDPTIDDPSQLSERGEYAARAEMVNRITLIKGALSGTYGRVQEVLDNCGPVKRDSIGGQFIAGKNNVKYYKNPPLSAGLPADGQDTRTSSGSDGQKANWGMMGLGMPGEGSTEIDGYERVVMYCWIRPNDFDLFGADERKEMEKAGIRLDSFIELWRFVIVDGKVVVQAEPCRDRSKTLDQSKIQDGIAFAKGHLPVFVSHMTQDQMKSATRSTMELLRGFQRFGSYLINIYIAGMRKNIWGVKAYDPMMFDGSSFSNGDVVGVLKSKMPGRDVRTGLMNLESSANVDQAITALGQTLDLVKNFFPSQAMPSQIASIDRAVKSQVAAVMTGAQRRLHMSAKIVDSLLMRPARMESFRNLRDNDDPESGPAGKAVSDEQVARVIGSGLASLEAERILEILREFLFAIIQNAESAQKFDVPGILNFMSKVANMSVDLGRFAKEQAPTSGGVQGAPAPGTPAGPTADPLAEAMAGVGGAPLG